MSYPKLSSYFFFGLGRVISQCFSFQAWINIVYMYIIYISSDAVTYLLFMNLGLENFITGMGMDYCNVPNFDVTQFTSETDISRREGFTQTVSIN